MTWPTLQGGWPDPVLTMQRNWIGRSTGAHVDFAIVGRDEPVRVFTTRPDTLFGATFFVVAADSPLADELCAAEQRAAFDAYLEQVRRTTDIERLGEGRQKTGVLAGPAADQPGQRRAASRSGRPTTCWPTTAPARSWPCPRTTSATWTSRGPSACRSGSSSTPASPTRARPASPPPATA